MAKKLRSVRSESTRGFTLVELMVTVAVLGILLGIATPSLVELIRHNRIATVSNEILGLVQYARSEAVKRAEDVDVVLANPGSEWTAEAKETTAGNAVLRAINNSGSVNLSAAQTLTFNYLGRLDPLSTITLGLSLTADSGISRKVIIEPSGRSCVRKESETIDCGES